MIPEHNLAVGPALRWLGLGMSMLFVLSVLFVYGGGALWRRLQRRALRRSLDRVAKLVAAVLLSFALLNSQLAYGQTQAQPKRLGHYQTLFTLASGISTQAKNVCKTEACARTADEVAAVIADGKEKHSKGLLVDETRKQFHTDFDGSMNKLRRALVASLPESEQKEIASRCPTCALKPVQNSTQAECELCYHVLEITAEICVLYWGICPTCALICLSTAALQFGHCVGEYCTQKVPGQFNEN